MTEKVFVALAADFDFHDGEVHRRFSAGERFLPAAVAEAAITQGAAQAAPPPKARPKAPAKPKAEARAKARRAKR